MTILFCIFSRNDIYMKEKKIEKREVIFFVLFAALDKERSLMMSFSSFSRARRSLCQSPTRRRAQ